MAYGLPIFGGLPVFGEATVVSSLDVQGCVKYHADSVNGSALAAAHRRKQRRYAELTAGDRGRLMLLGCEVGGRMATEAWQLLQKLVQCKCMAPALELCNFRLCTAGPGRVIG